MRTSRYISALNSWSRQITAHAGNYFSPDVSTVQIPEQPTSHIPLGVRLLWSRPVESLALHHRFGETRPEICKVDMGTNGYGGKAYDHSHKASPKESDRILSFSSLTQNNG